MPNGASCAWYHVAWLSQQGIAGWINKKTYRIEIGYGKGGSAFIPGGRTGVFLLRPLHPRKIKTYSSFAG
jgi:hypothetical protein